ncbi:MAG: hypothetical protein HY362_04280 [Candidatus Aenigmarchaeota archaeon]|nr:hypothetical protein [Candidatus Aenigmarchaeota archaeon]
MEPDIIAVVVHRGFVYADTFMSIWDMKKPGKFRLASVKGGMLDTARNRAVQEFLRDTKATHLFFVDSDMVLPADGLVKLLAHGKSIVSGIYFKKENPYYPVICREAGKGYEPVEDYTEGLIEIDGCGAGCLLISREAAETILKIVGEENGFPAFFSFAHGISEDFWFCEKAKEAGLKIFCDTTVKCGHLTENAVTERDWKGK